ncbi:transcription factor TFIIIB complex subunit brf1 [Coprinopsis cinerea AmutBmut pab1-1]|nr:transcription factor TFIIIB complex subunit brf1 [Coprinopsis cinerea AmutBmut pab1-1]
MSALTYIQPQPSEKPFLQLTTASPPLTSSTPPPGHRPFCQFYREVSEMGSFVNDNAHHSYSNSDHSDNLNSGSSLSASSHCYNSFSRGGGCGSHSCRGSRGKGAGPGSTRSTKRMVAILGATFLGVAFLGLLACVGARNEVFGGPGGGWVVTKDSDGGAIADGVPGRRDIFAVASGGAAGGGTAGGAQGVGEEEDGFTARKLYLIVIFIGLFVVLVLGVMLSAWCCKGAFRNPLCCPCYLCACCGGLMCLECIGCGLCAEGLEEMEDMK